MTTLTYTTRTPGGPSSRARALPGSAWLPGGRMIRAEFMKQARRRGLMIAAAILTVGAVVAYFAIEEALHLGNPRQYGPAGGTHGLVNADMILGDLGAIVAILFGASAGSADVTAGVFRNLVTTGRSRAALFLARIPAGVALSMAFTMAGYAVAVASSVLLNGQQHLPPAALIPAGLAPAERGPGLPAQPGPELGHRIPAHNHRGNARAELVRDADARRDERPAQPPADAPRDRPVPAPAEGHRGVQQHGPDHVHHDDHRGPDRLGRPRRGRRDLADSQPGRLASGTPGAPEAPSRSAQHVPGQPPALLPAVRIRGGGGQAAAARAPLGVAAAWPGAGR